MKSYKGRKVEIKNGHYYVKASNGTLRIFENEEYLKNFINNEVALESHARAMMNNPW